ncbi:MAG: DUF6056 family protein [Lachnospiraceae bacterium]|nr:DUF6056 family protein [Lachnospiraceae bacterium]
MKRQDDSFFNKISRIITPRNLALFLLALYIIALIPLLVIGHYNFPSADDYSEALEAHRAWVSNHSLFGTLWVALVRAIGDYFHWMGYFTCNILMAFSPTVFGGRVYIITSYLMIGMLSLSTAYFLNALFVRAFKMDRWISLSITMLTLLTTVECLPSTVEAFYWYLGAVNYTFIHGICLFYFGMMIRCAFDEKKRMGRIIGASILGFFAGGGNQMSALNAAIIVVGALVLLKIFKKKDELDKIRIPSIAYLVGFVLNICSPGNLVRAEGASGMNPVKAVLVSLYECLDRCIDSWTTWPVLLMIVLIVPLFYKGLENADFKFPCPFIVAIGGFCLTAAMVTPPLFALGNMEAGRIRSLTFMMYILLLCLVTGYVTGWVRTKLKASSGSADDDKDGLFTPAASILIAGVLAFGLFCAVLTYMPEPYFCSTAAAFTDLRNGSAKAYSDALSERAALYESGQKDITVEPLPTEPLVLYFSDITYEEEDWQRQSICRFYDLSSLTKSGGDK